LLLLWGGSVFTDCECENASNLLCIHDDLNTAAAAIAPKIRRWAGGYNGPKTISTHFGTSSDYWWLRIGIGHPGALLFIMCLNHPQKRKIGPWTKQLSALWTTLSLITEGE
jgi:peptidyl-tRNA hydrolase